MHSSKQNENKYPNRNQNLKWRNHNDRKRTQQNNNKTNLKKKRNKCTQNCVVVSTRRFEIYSSTREKQSQEEKICVYRVYSIGFRIWWRQSNNLLCLVIHCSVLLLLGFQMLTLPRTYIYAVVYTLLCVRRQRWWWWLYCYIFSLAFTRLFRSHLHSLPSVRARFVFSFSFSSYLCY